MTDFAQLGIKADANDLRHAITELRKLASAGMDTERSLENATNGIEAGFNRVKRAAMALAGPVIAGLSFRALTRDAAAAETQLLRIEAVLEATGKAADRTVAEFESFAQSLARSTLESVEGVLEAQKVLLTFGNVAGETFDKTITLAADMAATFGGTVVSNTRMLARALEDPANSLSLLGRMFPAFRGELRDTIREMVAMGDVAEAQALILQEIESRVGGVAQAASPLQAAQDSLSQSFRNLRLAINEATGATDRYAQAVRFVDGVVQAMSEDLSLLTDALTAVGLAAVALASTQLPALTLALYAKVTAVGAATAALTVYGAAMRGLAAVVATLGGPMGILLGLLVAAGGAAYFFRDRIFGTNDALGDVKQAQEALSAALGVFHSTAAPSAAAEAITLARAYREQAAAARDAAASAVAAARARYAEATGAMTGDPYQAFMAGEELAQKTRDLARAETALREAMATEHRTARDVTGTMSESMSDAVREAQELKVNIDDVTNSLEQLGRGGRGGAALEDMDDAVAGVVQRLQDEINAVGQSEQARRLHNELQAAGVELYSEEGQAIADLVEELYRLRSAQADVDNVTQQFRSSAESAFVSFATGAQNARQAVQQLLQSLVRLAAQSAFRSLFGGGGVTGLLSGVFGGLRAAGGPVEPGRSYIVGEQGPELFTPRQSGTIVPNDAIGGKQKVEIVVSAKSDPGVILDITEQAISQYDSELLPGRVSQISRDPWSVG